MRSQTRISPIFILQKKPPPPPPPHQILKISSITTRQQQQQQIYPKFSSTDSTLSSTPQTQHINHLPPNPIKSSSHNIRGQKTYPSRDPRTASFTSTPSSSSSSSIYCLTGSEYYWTGNRQSSAVAVVVGGGGEVYYDNKKNENGKSENIWWHWREERWNVACG